MAKSDMVSDGNVVFTGGMDTSRAPSLVGQNQYVWSVNMEIPKAKEGIRTRRGIKYVDVKFGSEYQREIFQEGNVQGIGNYYNVVTQQSVIIISVNGYIIELVKQNEGHYFANFLNFRNNPNIKKCHINNVPNGVIISDGESAPIYIVNGTSVRVSPSNRGIGPNHGGVYVQNRFWYIDQSRKMVIASTVQNPISLDEAILSNIYGFSIPDESEDFIAIGKQRTISRDTTGGNLSVASTRSNYSSDVRGDRANWGSASGIGKFDNVINGIGAISPFSYESANSNIYFRNADYGLMSTRSSQYQFINNDSYSPVSIESSSLFDNDTKDLLEFSYTKFYNTRIYNTIGPQVNEDGFVYWSGLLVMSPDIYFSTKDRAEINRVESVYTGIRPWCLTVAEDNFGSANMFIMSYDTDCVNRLYTIDEEIDYDIDYRGNRIDIESKLLTRLYDFGKPFATKKPQTQLFFINSKRNYELDLYSRTSPEVSFKHQFEQKIKIEPKVKKALYPFNTDSVISDRPVVFTGTDEEFHYKQDLFVFRGSINLLKHIRSAYLCGNDITANDTTDIVLEKSPCNNPDLIYSYSINPRECRVDSKDTSNNIVYYVEPNIKLVTDYRKDQRKYEWIRKGEPGEKGDKGDKGDRGLNGNSNLLYLNNLTGGGLSSLDGQSTVGKTPPFVITILVGLEIQDWILLVKTTEVEDGISYVQPDDNATRIWVRLR